LAFHTDSGPGNLWIACSNKSFMKSERILRLMEVSLSPPLICKKPYQNDEPIISSLWRRRTWLAGSLIPNKAVGLPSFFQQKKLISGTHRPKRKPWKNYRPSNSYLGDLKRHFFKINNGIWGGFDFKCGCSCL